MTPEPLPVLDAKQEREKNFHNEWARTVQVEDLKVHENFESPTAIENHYALKRMGDLRGKKLLDLGCGAGETSVYFALKGATVHACDIAEEFIKVTETLAARHAVSVQAVQAEASRLPYAGETFDIVFGNGVLHHVEVLPTGKEISRVLKKGGLAVFIEPLPYNPLINIYRHLAKGVRTEDEKPLTFSQLRALSPYFSSFDHQEFWLFSLIIFLHFYFVKRWDPSKVRYWKKVIEEGNAYKKMFTRLQSYDRFLIRTMPFLRPLCWNTVLVGIK